MRGGERASDLQRLRLGLALCIAGAAAVVGHATTWLCDRLGMDPVPDALVGLLWWAGVGAYAGGAAIIATVRRSRQASALAWVSCLAFAVVLFAHSAGIGPGPGRGRPHEEVARISAAWTACGWLIGAATIALAASRVAASRYRRARTAGAAVAGTIVVVAVASQLLMARRGGGSVEYAVAFAAHVLGPALSGAMAVMAWRAAPSMAIDANDDQPLGSVVLALPVVLAVRGVLQIAAWRADADGVARAATGDELLGLLTVACVMGLAFAQGHLRSRWTWMALVLPVSGLAVALAVGHAPGTSFIVVQSALGVLGARRPGGGTDSVDAVAVAHVAGIGAVCAVLRALAALGDTVGEADGARRARSAVGPLLVAAAATIRLPPPGSGEGAPFELVAMGAFALGTWRLWRGSLAIARAIPTPTAQAPVAVAGDDADAPPEHAPPPAAGSERNPYAAPSARPASRGRVGSPKLAEWRARVRRAARWVVLAPVAGALAANALVLVAALGGGSAQTSVQLFQGTSAAAQSLVTPGCLSHVVARALALGGVFAATRRPRVRLAGLGPAPRGAARVTAAIALAAWTAFAVLAIGLDSGGSFTPWLGPIDDLAYAASAFYAARLLAAGGRGAAAAVARLLSFGFAGLAAIEFLFLRGLDDWRTASLIDAYGASLLSLVGVGVLVSLRSMLFDGPRQ